MQELDIVTGEGSALYYLGGSDRRLALFENQYPLEDGVSYNSYLLRDGAQAALFDTVDAAIAPRFLQELEQLITSEQLELSYLIIQHMEPDHSAALGEVLRRYPRVQLVGSAQTLKMLAQFTGEDAAALGERFLAVRDGDTITLGARTLRFLTAPMVHWPEVIMSYDETDRLLFTADAFGSFGALCGDLYDDRSFWQERLDEARRYYCNIVGKYGTNVQAVLKKAAALGEDGIRAICPLHGPILRGSEAISRAIKKYEKWSSYEPEEPGDVLIVSGTVYGNTAAAAEELAAELAGARRVRLYDVAKTHRSYLIAEAFRCGTIVLAAPTLDAGLYPPMEHFLSELRAKNIQKRSFALIENGTWAPMAAKAMRALIEPLKDCTVLEPVVTLRSAMDESARVALRELGALLRRTDA